MCHVSVGHIARLFEENGIPTVVIASGTFEVRLKSMRVPRLLLTPYMMGMPLGFSGETNIHRRIVSTGLSLFEKGDQSDPVIEYFSP